MAEKIRMSYKEKKEAFHDSHIEYFEGVVQLREGTAEQMDEIFAYINDNNIRISKQIAHKNGVDFYVTSQKFVQQLAKWIPLRYKCQLGTSRTLHTRDTKLNKDLYRVTLLVEFVDFTIGDVIEYKGDRVKITSLGKKPVGRILLTGERIFLDTKVLRRKD
jgi:NMD protein affecting ribosome stability and mRNA decay